MIRRKQLKNSQTSEININNDGTSSKVKAMRHGSVKDAESDEEDLRAQIRNDVNEENLLNMEIPPMPEPIMSADGNGNRLMLTSINVENFKSYYGKHVLGPFHHNFSAVIGPNGSGKSNVIDSLLFVFGYRASKIRSKKISVLIHSSAGREDISSCTVGVNFQKIIDLPDGSYDVVPHSQFTVSRTAFRDNSSKYTYNGKTMQFKEIATLLRDGEVEQIALMKPKALNENDDGMLEYLEDIIGSSRLKVPIEKIQQKIDQLQEERSAQLNRTKFAEKEKIDAEGPMANLVTELRVDNGVALTKNRLFQAEKCGIKLELKADEEKKEKLEKELEVAKQRQQEVLALQKNRKDEQKELQKAFDKIQEEFEKTKHQLSEFEQAEKRRKAELLRLNEKRSKLVEDITKEEKKIAELEQVPLKAKKKLEEFLEILNGIDDEITRKQTEVDAHLKEVQEQTAIFEDPKKTLEEQLGKLTAKEDEASSKLTLAQESLQLMRREEEMENKKLLEVRTELGDSKSLLESKKKQILPNINKELHALQCDFMTKKKEETECADRVRQLMSKFERKRVVLEEYQTHNKMLRRLMQEKSSGNIPGIYGRLGDLGAIDEKYDVAISTTCGALDFIIVDNIETAQTCIEFLKRENLGIGSFMALDKQDKFRQYMGRLPSTPENVPRLFDLIRVKDPAILPAFYSVLRDTLVANDITAATRIGLDGNVRWRVVTLNGEVVETSGAMTGGGNSQKRGRIGQNVRIDTTTDSVKVTELKKALDEEQNRLATVRSVMQKLNSRIVPLQADQDRLTKNEQSLSHEIGHLERKVVSMEQILKEQLSRLESVAIDEKSIEQKKIEIAKLEEVRDRALQAAEDARNKVAEINSKIQKIYDQVVGPHQIELDAIRLRKENASKGATKEQSILNNAQRNTAKAMSRKIDLENDKRGTEEAITKLESVEDNKEVDINKLTKQKIQQEKSLKEAESKVKEALEKNSELDAEEVELKKKCIDSVRLLSEHSKSLEHKLGKLTSIDNKMKTLHLCYVECLDRLPESLQANNDDDDYGLHEALQIEREFFKKLKSNELVAEADQDGIIRYSTMPSYTEEEIKTFNLQNIKFSLVNLEKRKAGKVVNTNGLQEYLTKLQRYDREVEALAEISTKRDKHRQFCEQLKKQRMNEFMDGFTRIGLALKEMYQMITLGGDASLDLVDSLDPFSEGVSFGVRPPKKSWKQITNLSGGEKTLSSLALVFALHHYRPTPLYVMDEIDAALDFRNVSIIGHYIKDRTKNAQFIIISLRNNMFELADRLIGIYKTFDCTKSVAIDPYIVQSIIKPLHALKEVKKGNMKSNDKQHVNNDIDLTQVPFREEFKVSDEMTNTNTDGSRTASAVSGLFLSFSMRMSGYFLCFYKSRSKTASPLLVPPPIKKRSPKNTETPVWDVPPTITVRRSRAASIHPECLNGKLDSIVKDGYTNGVDNNEDDRSDASSNSCGAASKSKRPKIRLSDSKHSGKPVSDTDRLEQFAQML
ncbi:unnamed protein product [Thelazia callipaeda]|uniref:Structural maintenance of chromosomes protein n=1 Tax=Thelazia callipaeda TaxID=103827 RepID=A0A0N5CYB9_THECL|nr:unnamed protein product [Thelazia callipaeda]